MPDYSPNSIDYAVIVAYFLVVMYIGLRMARRVHNGEDLFLACRRLGWIPIGFCLFAFNVSSTTSRKYSAREFRGGSVRTTADSGQAKTRYFSSS